MVYIFIKLTKVVWFGSVVVITLASHARGPGFDPQPNQFFFHLTR